MPFNANDPSFGPYRGSVIKMESQPDGIEQLAAANLYVLSGGQDFSPGFVTDFEPQHIDLASPFLYLQRFQWTLLLLLNKYLRRSRYSRN